MRNTFFRRKNDAAAATCAAGNTAVVVFAYALVALCVAAYFLFFRNTDTGTNADEKLSGDYPV